MKKLLLFLVLLTTLSFVYSVDVDDTTGESITTFVGNTNPIGLYIESKTNDYLKEVEVASGNTATRCRIWESTYTTVLATSTSRTGDTFTFTPYQLTNGDNYFILCDDNGATYNYGYSGTGVSFPYSGTNIDFIASSFNGGTQTNRVFVIDRIRTGPVSGSILETNIQNYYDSTAVTVNGNLTPATNLSYVLNGGSNISLGSVSTFEINLTGIEGNNVLDFYHDGSKNQINFTVDTTQPVVVNNMPTESDSYTVNFNSSTCTDTNIDTCVLTIGVTPYDLLTVSSATMSSAINYSYTILATDLAGNTRSVGGTFLVNPYAYFYFEDNLSNPVTNFTLNNIQNNGPDYHRLQYYNDGLSIGSNTLVFRAQGFARQTINFTLSAASPYFNTTYTANVAQIVINLRDKDTGSLITGTNFSAEFIATVGATVSDTDGTINVINSLFQNESYIVTITSNDYFTEQLFFNFQNIEYLELDAYFSLKNDTGIGTIFVKAVDLGSKPVKGATVYAQQWFPSSSSYLTVTSATTGEDGLASLNVILNDKNYRFRAIKDGASGTSVTEIIDTTENGKTITIPLDSTFAVQQYFLQNLNYNVSEVFNSTTNISTVTLDYTNADGTSVTVCINQYRSISNSDVLQSSNCDTGVSGQLIQAYFINSSNYVTIKAEALYDSKYTTLDRFVHPPKNSPQSVLLDFGLAPYLMPVLFLLSVMVGLRLENVYIGMFLLILSSGISLLLVPTLINGGIVAGLMFLGSFIIYAGVKPR